MSLPCVLWPWRVINSPSQHSVPFPISLALGVAKVASCHCYPFLPASNGAKSSALDLHSTLHSPRSPSQLVWNGEGWEVRGWRAPPGILTRCHKEETEKSKTGLCIFVRRKSWEESVINAPFVPVAMFSIIPQIPNVSYVPEPTAGSVKTGRHPWH